MNRGEIYRTRDRVPERVNKPGYYLVVSRSFIAKNEDVSTVVCAPVYSEILGLATELTLGSAEGLPKASAARCDFLMLMFKAKLTMFVGSLARERAIELDHALRVALAIGAP